MTNPKIEISDKKGAVSRRGFTWLSWERLEKRLQECGELTPYQTLEALEVRAGGFAFTTQSKDEEVE